MTYFFIYLSGYKNTFRKAQAMRLQQRFFSVLIISFLIIFSTGMAMGSDENSSSAPTSDRLFSESAFITGFGTGSIDEGHYQTALLIWHLGVNLDRVFPSLKSHKGKLTFFIEPQFNPVANPDEDFEFGLSLGLQYQYPIMEKLSAYVLAAVGPHYISVVTDDQANGLVFSDMAGVGLYYHLTNRSAINVGYRFRHLSNAGIAMPNEGIDSHFGVIGYSVFFN
jgi:lipid A 3-O-deacylase